MRVLVVEDDNLVADAIVRVLAAAGFQAQRVASAEAAQATLLTQLFDLAVIDVGLPGADGLSLVRRLRKTSTLLPALVLTARDTLNDKVQALDLGADDFLSKPFEPAELIARCRALVRRASASFSGNLQLDRLQIDLFGKRLFIDDAEVELTAREWLVLETLARHIGRIVSKEHLLQAIANMNLDMTSNAVEVYVSRLRAKLGNAAVIRGLRGLGYRLEESKRQ